MSILVIGSGGNLGSEFSEIAEKEFNLVRGTNNPKSDSDFRVIPSVGISSVFDMEIELIINFANSYFPSPNAEQAKKMRTAIVGVAEAIQKYNLSSNIPLITFASYFQFAPKEMQPWSLYSELKDEASSIYQMSGVAWTEVILRDNFGGRRKDKFLDRALEANVLGVELETTEGQSLINLTHIKDICEYLVSLANEMILKREMSPQKVELRSERTMSLRELITLIDDLRGSSTKINWGALPYREHEVFEEWVSAPLPSSWHTKRPLEDYILNYKS